jgi:hypothetical protein
MMVAIRAKWLVEHGVVAGVRDFDERRKAVMSEMSVDSFTLAASRSTERNRVRLPAFAAARTCAYSA